MAGRGKQSMERKRQAAQEVFYCVETDAHCTSARSGQMLAKYLFGELSLEQCAKFERHLDDCIACSAAVVTARNLLAALQAEERSSGVDPAASR
jgi:anti-sigma factor RsiW